VIVSGVLRDQARPRIRERSARRDCAVALAALIDPGAAVDADEPAAFGARRARRQFPVAICSDPLPWESSADESAEIDEASAGVKLADCDGLRQASRFFSPGITPPTVARSAI